MMPIWKIKAQITTDKPDKRRQQIITALLKNRGLTTKKDQHQFLEPTPPNKLTSKIININSTHLKKAITRIKQAIKNQELIYIYGDYDTDGITATAILWETLDCLKAKVLPYIPHRDDPVRGLSSKGIKEIINHKPPTAPKPSLIITVDNGITSFKGCQYAKKQGIDVIITDHHQPKHHRKKTTLPPALAIISTTDLAGAGISWFFSRQLLRALKPKSTPTLPTLELAALGTIADMVPLTGSNRSLVKFGLEKLRNTTRPGLKALAKSANLDLKLLQAWQVSFLIAPRLNAMGRLEHALDALRLLCTKDNQRAKQLADLLNHTNLNRQNLNDQMFIHAQKQWQNQDQDNKLIFVSHPTYHEGIVGLVAGRLAEKFSRPAIVISEGETTSKGSARSPQGINLIKILRQIETDLLELGGHQLAAGFTIETKKIPAIQKKLNKLITANIADKDFQPSLTIDCQIELKDINWELYDLLQQLQPFGFQNKTPLFATRQVTLTNFRTVGQNQKHLQLEIENDTKAIAFNQGYLANQLKTNQPIDIAYTIDKNEWNNQKTLQLKIKSILTQV